MRGGGGGGEGGRGDLWEFEECEGDCTMGRTGAGKCVTVGFKGQI